MDLFARSLEERICSTIQRLEMRMRAYDQALDALLDHSKPRSNGVFCPYEENGDAHPTGRCPRYAGAIARAVQANVMSLCARRLQARHATDCGLRCAICGAEHNMLMCPTRTQRAQAP
ncbi:hypothetical protein Aduo_016043 [Ancylostoma duodenale]